MSSWRSFLRRGAALSLSTLSGVLIAVLPAHAAPSGPDVSSWQHGGGSLINWFAVKSAGYDFAMVKATEGLSYINPYYVPDSLMIRAAGLSRGTYHYARPNLPPEPQAVLYAAVALGQNGPYDLPPVLDLEHTGGLGPAALIDWTRRYLSTVQALTGRVPIIYTYPSFWRTAMADTTEFANHPLWIADYRGNPQPEVPGGWRTWTFWQTTDSGSIPGIAGPVDLNVYSGAQGDLASYANIR
ncbi:glycoside hydrolase family 25 protein [Nocardia sp. 004]|uniref:glycoside hydrolase family 25 protein n=1 Tax=Nocardia sp. 004 TaxID=3385978 RepID=UPI00399F6EFE